MIMRPMDIMTLIPYTVERLSDRLNYTAPPRTFNAGRLRGGVTDQPAEQLQSIDNRA
jgi:hypothetical protein